MSTSEKVEVIENNLVINPKWKQWNCYQHVIFLDIPKPSRLDLHRMMELNKNPISYRKSGQLSLTHSLPTIFQHLQELVFLIMSSYSIFRFLSAFYFPPFVSYSCSLFQYQKLTQRLNKIYFTLIFSRHCSDRIISSRI